MQITLNEADLLTAVQSHLATILPGLDVTDVELTDDGVTAEVVPAGTEAPPAPPKKKRRSRRSKAEVAPEPAPVAEDEAANTADDAPFDTDEPVEDVPEEAPAVSGVSLFG